MTAIVHGAAAADEARRAAEAAFGGGGDESAIPTYDGRGHGEKIVDVLAASGLAACKSVARRLVEQGGVRVGDRKVASVDDVLRVEEIGDGVLLHAGKKSMRRLVLEGVTTDGC